MLTERCWRETKAEHSYACTIPNIWPQKIKVDEDNVRETNLKENTWGKEEIVSLGYRPASVDAATHDSRALRILKSIIPITCSFCLKNCCILSTNPLSKVFLDKWRWNHLTSCRKHSQTLLDCLPSRKWDLIAYCVPRLRRGGFLSIFNASQRISIRSLKDGREKVIWGRSYLCN